MSATVAIANQVRDAARAAQSLRIVAGGTWLHAGGMVNAATTLSVADDRGIVEYVPGDLTLTARAATPVADLVAAVKANEQWLPLDPWGGDGGTLGATLSTSTAGPHAHAMGLPRDVALGLEFVSGSGDVVRAGGRVVKNVAGFDLTRLMIGAWGTLGVITEATLRLRARPAVLRSFVLAIDARSGALDALAVNLRALPFTPLACEVVNGALARRLEIGDAAMLALRVAGNAHSVAAQTDALAKLGGLHDAPDQLWRRLREADRGSTASWRRSQLPSAFGETWRGVEHSVARAEGALIHGSPLRGVVRAIATGDPDTLRRVATDGPGTLAIEVLPVAAMPTPRGEQRGTDALEERVRRTFDPHAILNPGIMDGRA